MKPILLTLLILQVAPGQPAPPNSATAREARSLRVNEKATVTINTSVLQSTLLVLPENEKIMSVFDGDKENWRFDTTKMPGRFLSVKPVAPGVSTDLHLISDHGNSYSFLLREVSDRPGAQFDSKVFLEADDSLKPSITRLPEFVPVAELDRYRTQAEEAKAAADRSAKEADARKQEVNKGAEAFRAAYPAKLRFNYRWDAKAGTKLGVQQIFADDRFTYIRAKPQEAATLYELKDGKPSLVNFDFADGVYTVAKHVERGYLAIGKTRMDFWEERN